MAQWIEEFIRTGGYWALALITFVENILTPIPSEVIIPLGGYLVAQGRLTFWGVVVAGTVGSYAGALVLFYLGKQLKRRRLEAWADKHGSWLLVTKGDVSSAFEWFDRHGGAAVFFCRVVPGLRSIISVPAGASNMAIGTFSLYTIVGSALWTALLTGVGMWLGQQYQDTGEFLKWINYVVIGLIVVSVVGWWFKRRSEDKLDEETS